MTKILAGHTLHTHGVLNPPHYLDVEAGGAIVAGGGATNNGTISLYGSTQASLAGGAASVLAQVTAINGVNGKIFLYGGGSETSTVGAGATLNVAGTLANRGEISLFSQNATQPVLGGGAPLVDVQASGYLANSGTLLLGGAVGSPSLPGVDVNASSLTVEGVLANTGYLAVVGGLLGAGYGGSGARVLLDGASGTGVVNTGSIAIGGGNGGINPLGPPAPRYGGMVTVQSGTLLNQGQITVGAGVNNSYGYADAGGVLQSVLNGVIVNTDDITVYGQTTGYMGPTPAGLLANNGAYFRSTGYIDIMGGSVPGGPGGTFTTSTMFDLAAGMMYLQAGLGGGGNAPAGGGGVADLGGTVMIGVSSQAVLLVGGPKYAEFYLPASATITGHTYLGAFGTIATIGTPEYGYGGFGGGVTVGTTGTLSIHGGYVTGYGTLTNLGQIVSTGISTIENIGMVINDSTVAVDGGTLLVQADPFVGYVGGAGTFAITGGGRLGFYTGPVGPGQQIVFGNTPGLPETLAIGAPYYMEGVLTGLNDSSVLDFVGQQVTGVSAGGHFLSILEPGETYLFTLAAPLPAGTTFTMTPDGMGGTDVGFELTGQAIGARVAGDVGARDSASVFAGHLSA